MSDDDGLRDELAAELMGHKEDIPATEWDLAHPAERARYREIADALEPVVARHVEQVRTDEQTRIAQDIKRHSREPLAGFGPYRLGLNDAASIARGGDTP